MHSKQFHPADDFSWSYSRHTNVLSQCALILESELIGVATGFLQYRRAVVLLVLLSCGGTRSARIRLRRIPVVVILRMLAQYRTSYAVFLTQADSALQRNQV